MRKVCTAILLTLGLAFSANPGFARERGFSAYDRIDRAEGRGHADDHTGARNSQAGKQGVVSHHKKTSRAHCGPSSAQAKKQGCRDPFTMRRRSTPRSHRQSQQPASFQQPHSETQVHGVVVR